MVAIQFAGRNQWTKQKLCASGSVRSENRSRAGTVHL